MNPGAAAAARELIEAYRYLKRGGVQTSDANKRTGAAILILEYEAEKADELDSGDCAGCGVSHTRQEHDARG